MRLHELDESLRTENPCWKGYYPVGTKKKNGRTVPNCVPKKTKRKKVSEDINVVDLEFLDGTRSSIRARTSNPVKTVFYYFLRQGDLDKLRQLKSVDGKNVTEIVKKLFKL